ncbi:uncharacterized protein LOC144430555 isoform X1 [Styela clava]
MLEKVLEQMKQLQERTEKQLEVLNAKIAEQGNELEKTGKRVKHQYAKIAEQRKKSVEMNNKLHTVQKELCDMKDPETVYKKLGGKTPPYMDLETCYKMMEDECKGDKEKLK